MAFVLQIWNKLTDEQRKSFATLRGGKLLATIRAEATRVKVSPLTRPPELGRIQKTRIDADPTLKALVGTPEKSTTPSAEQPGISPKRPAHPYAEFLYFDDAEHRPRPVASNHLQRFQTSCPPWLLAMTDPLTADDARAYMTVLYRLLYPFPAEMPEKAPVAPNAGTPKPAPRPGATPPTGRPISL